MTVSTFVPFERRPDEDSSLSAPLLAQPNVPSPPASDVLGFPVATGTLQDNAARIAAAASQGHGLRVVTLNLEMIARSLVDPAYDELLRRADLFVADGVPLIWLSRLGTAPPITGRTNGTDLVEFLLTSPGMPSIGLIGGLDPRRMLSRLDVSADRVALVVDGDIDVSEAGIERLAQRIAESRCRIVLIGLGVPKQDRLAAALRIALPTVVTVAVGGSFDLLAGIKPRAPRWMQLHGLEWLHRLATEPRRLWRRYLLLYPRVATAAVAWLLDQRRRRATLSG